jgi:hypothetical protein
MSNTGKSRIKIDDLKQPYDELSADEAKLVRGGASTDDDDDDELPQLHGSDDTPQPEGNPAGGGGASLGSISTGKPSKLGVRPPIIKK